MFMFMEHPPLKYTHLAMVSGSPLILSAHRDSPDSSDTLQILFSFFPFLRLHCCQIQLALMVLLKQKQLNEGIEITKGHIWVCF